MNQNKIKKLLTLLPDGAKKEALMAKLEKFNALGQRKGNGGAVHDEFSMKPTGHIRIEEIDDNGQVVGVLADRKNLVVKGSEEILLRAFSGDPKRTLYKNRKIKEYKDANGVIVKGKSKPYNVDLAQVVTVVDEEDTVPYHQNEVWKAVKDEDFDVEYSYFPNTLYVKEEALPLEPDMVTFRLYTKEEAPVGAAPLQAEVYSNYTNLFIGLGDGKNKRIAFSDSRIQAVGFTEQEGKFVATTVGSKVQFSSKVSNVVIKAEGEGSLKVVAGGVEKGILSLTGAEGGKTLEVVGLDAEIETEVSIEMTTGANVKITEIAFDEFSIYDNALMGEFENHTLRFDTPTQYNANAEKGPEGTYTIQLNHMPIAKDSLVVTYDAADLTAVETIDELEVGTYFLEAEIGRLHLAEPLTAVMASYNVTGEIHEDEPVTGLATGATSIVRKTIEDSGEVSLTTHLDGIKTVFDTGFKRVQNADTIVVKINNVIQTKGTHYTFDGAEGKLTLIPMIIPAQEEVLDTDGVTVLTPAQEEQIVIPDSSDTLVIESFKYEKHTAAALNTYIMTLAHEVDNKKVRVYDQTNKELTFVQEESELLEGSFTLRRDSFGKWKEIVVVKENADLVLVQKLEVYYNSAEKPGEVTDYRRQVIEKPKTQNEYPWFKLDKGQIQFVAEFKENVPGHNVTIREMGLFDGPRVEDGIRGFNDYNVKAFSLVRVGETRKEATTGLRVTWTISLLNEEGKPFKGGL